MISRLFDMRTCALLWWFSDCSYEMVLVSEALWWCNMFNAKYECGLSDTYGV